MDPSHIHIKAEMDIEPAADLSMDLPVASPKSPKKDVAAAESALETPIAIPIDPKVIKVTKETAAASEDPDVTSAKASNWRKVSTGMDFIEICKRSLATNPWNTDMWSSLLKEAVTLNDPAVVRSAFEDFLKYFPTNVLDSLRS